MHLKYYRTCWRTHNSICDLLHFVIGNDPFPVLFDRLTEQPIEAPLVIFKADWRRRGWGWLDLLGQIPCLDCLCIPPRSHVVSMLILLWICLVFLTQGLRRHYCHKCTKLRNIIRYEIQNFKFFITKYSGLVIHSVNCATSSGVRLYRSSKGGPSGSGLRIFSAMWHLWFLHLSPITLRRFFLCSSSVIFHSVWNYETLLENILQNQIYYSKCEMLNCIYIPWLDPKDDPSNHQLFGHPSKFWWWWGRSPSQYKIWRSWSRHASNP